MFSSREYLAKKTGPYGIGRLSYLQQLVTEFQDIESAEAKKQVLANLANFAYDPINYDYMRQLGVIDLFLEPEVEVVEFAIGGICNLCLDKQNKDYILKNGGIPLVKQSLSSPNEETVISAITTLMYLTTPDCKEEITALPVVDAMLRFANSKNPRLSNLATIFLEDYCSVETVQLAREANQQWQQQVQAEAAQIHQSNTQPKT